MNLHMQRKHNKLYQTLSQNSNKIIQERKRDIIYKHRQIYNSLHKRPLHYMKQPYRLLILHMSALEHKISQQHTQMR